MEEKMQPFIMKWGVQSVKKNKEDIFAEKITNKPSKLITKIKKWFHFSLIIRHNYPSI